MHMGGKEEGFLVKALEGFRIKSCVRSLVESYRCTIAGTTTVVGLGGYEAQINTRCLCAFTICSDSFPEDGPSDERRAVCDARLDIKPRKLGFDRTEYSAVTVYTREGEPGSQNNSSLF